MRKLILILTLIFSAQQIFSCTCIGNSSISDDIKSSKLIFKGKIIKKEVITIYDSDSLSIKRFYDDLNNKKEFKSYEDYKESIWGIKLLEYTVQKKKMFKGRNKSEFIKIRSGFGNGDCGYEFQMNKTYLIFANKAEYFKNSKNRSKSKWKKLTNVFETNICMRTKLFGESTNELKKF